MDKKRKYFKLNSRGSKFTGNGNVLNRKKYGDSNIGTYKIIGKSSNRIDTGHKNLNQIYSASNDKHFLKKPSTPTGKFYFLYFKYGHAFVGNGKEW